MFYTGRPSPPPSNAHKPYPHYPFLYLHHSPYHAVSSLPHYPQYHQHPFTLHPTRPDHLPYGLPTTSHSSFPFPLSPTYLVEEDSSRPKRCMATEIHFGLGREPPQAKPAIWKIKHSVSTGYRFL